MISVVWILNLVHHALKALCHDLVLHSVSFGHTLIGI